MKLKVVRLKLVQLPKFRGINWSPLPPLIIYFFLILNYATICPTMLKGLLLIVIMIFELLLTKCWKQKLILQFQARQSLIIRGLFPVLADPQHLVCSTHSVQLLKDVDCFIMSNLMISGWLNYMADFKVEEPLSWWFMGPHVFFSKMSCIWDGYMSRCGGL